MTRIASRRTRSVLTWAVATLSVVLLVAGLALGRPAGTPVLALAVLVAVTGAAFTMVGRRR